MANEDAKTRPKKRGKKFGFYFAIATSLLRAAAIIFTTFYSMRCITFLMKDYKETTIAYNNLISTTLVKSFARDKETDNFAETDDMAQLLKQTEYVAYAYDYYIK